MPGQAAVMRMNALSYDLQIDLAPGKFLRAFDLGPYERVAFDQKPTVCAGVADAIAFPFAEERYCPLRSYADLDLSPRDLLRKFLYRSAHFRLSLLQRLIAPPLCIAWHFQFLLFNRDR
jgi:hypothetical protein